MPRRSACSSSRVLGERRRRCERPRAEALGAELVRALVHVVEVLDEGDRPVPRAGRAEGLREDVPADRHEPGRVHVVREVDLRLHPERVVGAAALVVEDAPVGDPQVDEGRRLRALAAQGALVAHPAGTERDESAQPPRAPVERLLRVGGSVLVAEETAGSKPRTMSNGKMLASRSTRLTPLSRLSRMTDPRRWIISPMAIPPREVEAMSLADIFSVSPQHSHSRLPATARDDEPQNPRPVERPAL